MKEEVAILGGAGRGLSYFDPFAYRPITTAKFGSAGFNSLTGSAIVNIDAGLFREFSFTEHAALCRLLSCNQHVVVSEIRCIYFVQPQRHRCG